MKKLTVLAVAAILTLGGASSCKKARTCTCDDGTSWPMGSAKLKDQKTACDQVALGLGTSCSVK